jgi:hypothetical protein
VLHAFHTPRVRLIVSAIALAILAGAFAIGYVHPAPAHAQKPPIDAVYVNGTTAFLINPHAVANPDANLVAHSPDLYIVSFPVDTSCAPNCSPITLPSGHVPQCNPCFHPGLPAPFVFHDHLLTGAPGFGSNGTAGNFKGTWQVIVLQYTPQYAFSPSFKPVTTTAELDAAEAAGAFQPIAQGINPQNPFEIRTGSVLIADLVSSHA